MRLLTLQFQQADGSSAKAAPPYLRYNEYGGSIGGPIIKNKLFVFFVVDKIYNNGAPATHVSTVPTLAERGMGTAFPGDYDFSRESHDLQPPASTQV